MIEASRAEAEEVAIAGVEDPRVVDDDLDGAERPDPEVADPRTIVPISTR